MLLHLLAVMSSGVDGALIVLSAPPFSPVSGDAQARGIEPDGSLNEVSSCSGRLIESLTGWIKCLAT